MIERVHSRIVVSFAGGLATVIGVLAILGCAAVPFATSTPRPTPSSLSSAKQDSRATTSARPVEGPTTMPTTALPTQASAPASPAGTSEATDAAGPPVAGCINGWISPAEDSAVRQEGLELLAASMGVAGPFNVSEMRYFTGPDMPGVIEPHYESVERWYIKASLIGEPKFRARWLLEKRTETVKGISGVAPFDSEGFNSPDWSGFVGDGPPTEYKRLPGEWYGIRYDFVTGEGDSGQPGLPPDLLECLAGS
jgi:hypothetical protein